MDIVDNTMCAPCAKAEDWNNINWQEVEAQVKKLQIRIAKAIRERKYGKAKSLQWLLTHSYCAKLLALKRVVSNKGKSTPGVDGIVWKTSRQKLMAVKTLKRRGYKPMPLRRIYIPKKNGKRRPLSIPTMRDRAIQALHALALQPIAETSADINSYGFRVGRSTHDAVGQCFIALAKSYSAQWILEGDIKACFDGINHEWMLENIQMDKKILKASLRAGYIEEGHLYPTNEGTPQGGIISPILANMTLDGLEKAIKDATPNRCKVNFIRYADDFIVTGAYKELLEDKVIPAIKQFLTQRGLTLSFEKTQITHINDGFDFLGVNIRKYNGKLLFKPAKASIQSLLGKVKRIIKSLWGASPEALIRKLNAVIRGWVNYHRYIVAKATFNDVDKQIRKLLKRWAKRRHSKKTWGWI